MTCIHSLLYCALIETKFFAISCLQLKRCFLFLFKNIKKNHIKLWKADIGVIYICIIIFQKWFFIYLSNYALVCRATLKSWRKEKQNGGLIKILFPVMWGNVFESNQLTKMINTAYVCPKGYRKRSEFRSLRSQWGTLSKNW